MVIRMLENVQQATISLVLRALITHETRVYTDEYDIYHCLPEWGFDHRTVCHSQANTPDTMTEMAFTKSTSTPLRGSGRCSVPGCGPHRGLSQAKLPLYLGFFQFVHNARLRGKGLLRPLLELLLT